MRKKYFAFFSCHPIGGKILGIYNRLLTHFGPQGWWPGETKLEVIVGAILTQNTAWRNASRAIENLKRENLLDVHKLYKAKKNTLRRLLRPSGYYNVKTERLKELMRFIVERYEGDIGKLEEKPGEELREELLAVKGIGNETADSILLYALNKPFFVVDAYTKRVLLRHNLLPAGGYDEIQAFFHNNLPRDAKLYNEFHALFVRLGKTYCQRKPKCSGCPLEGDLFLT